MLLYSQMPQTKSAKKALRVDRRRAKINRITRLALKRALMLAQRKPELEKIKETIGLADRAAKKGIIHPNKASRLKSRLDKLMRQTPASKITPKIKKTPKKKANPKK